MEPVVVVTEAMDSKLSSEIRLTLSHFGNA